MKPVAAMCGAWHVTAMKWVIASDHAGFPLKQALLAHMQSKGMDVRDLGTRSTDSVDYPDFADAAAHAILSGEAKMGVLVCGSGIGISIAANRHKGIRAALCRSVEDATLSRQHNNANILCLGGRITDEATAKACVDAFASTAFEGGRHQGRVEKMG